MQLIKNVLGLDIGSHTIKAVELKQTLRGLEPVQLRVHPRVDPDAPLDEVLRRFVRLHGLATDHVVAAMPGDRVSLRRLEFPFRDHKRLNASVPFEVEGEIPFELDDVVVDWRMVGGERGHAAVAAAVAQRAEVESMLATLKVAGCDPRILEAEGLVLGNLAALFELAGTRLLIDFGARKTTFCLVIDGMPVAARTAPIGSDQLTRALASDRGIPYEQAEVAKCEDGVFRPSPASAPAGDFESDSDAAVAVLDRLTRELVRTLDALEPVLGGRPESQVAAITLLGGGSRLHRLDEYLSLRVGVPAARLALPAASEGAAFVAGGDPLLFAPAIALALRGTSRSTGGIDLRQGGFAYRTNLRSFLGSDLRPTALLAGGTALLLFASSVTSMSLDARRAGAVHDEVERLYAEAMPGKPMPANPVREMRSAVDQKRELADFLGVYGGQHSALDLLGELSARVPNDLEVKFEEVTIDGRSIRIKVRGESFEAAERLEAALSAAPPFTDTKVASEIQTDRQSGMKTFQLRVTLGASESGDAG